MLLLAIVYAYATSLVTGITNGKENNIHTYLRSTMVYIHVYTYYTRLSFSIFFIGIEFLYVRCNCVILRTALKVLDKFGSCLFVPHTTAVVVAVLQNRINTNSIKNEFDIDA